MKRIGFFGGSFNPPHIGHAAVCRWLLDMGQVDEIWVVPCFVHPFAKELAPFEDRYRMCLFAFGPLGPKVVVSRIEEELGGASLTIRTVKYLLKDYPRWGFFLIVGSDISEESDKWSHFDEIKRLVPIIEVPRGPKTITPDVSATEIRKKIASHEPFVHLVPPEVAAYIVTHGLYK